MDQTLSKWLCSLIILTFLLIIWGVVVRGTGSGLGCPDWPLCFGQWIPPFRQDVLIEYTHRLLASFVGLMTLGISMAVWRNRKWRSIIGKWCGIALVLLLLQAGLGGITVMTELHPLMVTTHLGMALLFYAVIFYMFLRMRKGGDKSAVPKNKWYRFSHWTLTILFLQMILGGLVAAHQAGLACPDFPTCQGLWLPTLEGPVGLHFFHRVGALVVTLMVLWLVKGAWGLTSVKVLFCLVWVQVLLGIGNVLMGLPLLMRIAHNGVAVLLFLGLMTTTYELRRFRS